MGWRWGVGERVQSRIPPDASRVLFVRNLPYAVEAEDLYKLFGKYGSIRQVRAGVEANPKTRGTAFVVYDDIFDAVHARDSLAGYKYATRYLQVWFFTPTQRKPRDLEQLRQEKEAAERRAEALAKAAKASAE